MRSNFAASMRSAATALATASSISSARGEDLFDLQVELFGDERLVSPGLQLALVSDDAGEEGVSKDDTECVR